MVDEFVGILAGGVGVGARFEHFLRPLHVEQVVAGLFQIRSFR